jgi:hypothetical protein
MSNIIRYPRPKRFPRPKMPKTRGGCEDLPRPCPFVRCKYNLFLDIERGRVKTYGDNPLEMERSCALDEAEKGGLKLDEICDIYGLSRERIRQIVEHALRKMRFQHVQDTLCRRP